MTDLSPTLSIALTGDALLTRGIIPPGDAATRALYATIRAQDVAFTNLEFVASDFRGDPSEIGGSHLMAPSSVLDEVLAAGFDLFTAANNHAGDYGVAGLVATLEEMEKRGMTHAGTGRKLADARMPAYLQRAAGTVSLLACSSTFVPGQDALDQRPEVQGRPGVSPLRFETVYEVTPPQAEALRAITRELGLERQRLERIRKGFAWPPADPALVLLGRMTFREAAQAAIRTRANPRDVEDILRWVREARSRSDVVIFSVHSHEQGATDEDVPEFLPPFCRRLIDEGVDIVVGHGPHLLRGMEMYKGRPIFYSLGNFYGQSDLVSRFAADVYARYRVAHDQTPGAIVDSRTGKDTRSFPADPRYWETVMPVCRFGEAGLEIDLHPVTLGFGEKVHRRGMPKLAEGAVGAAILDRLAALSAPFGTRFDRSGPASLVARVSVAS
jgi:poly-gamma-glutamate capsule biosynthesis protein CapA/YwtB (metallophosphatase superfamily)